MVEALGIGAEAEEHEAFSAIGSAITSMLGFIRQALAYGYQVALWLIDGLRAHPFQGIAFAVDAVILLG